MPLPTYVALQLFAMASDSARMDANSDPATLQDLLEASQRIDVFSSETTSEETMSDAPEQQELPVSTSSSQEDLLEAISQRSNGSPATINEGIAFEAHMRGSLPGSTSMTQGNLCDAPQQHPAIVPAQANEKYLPEVSQAQEVSSMLINGNYKGMPAQNPGEETHSDGSSSNVR